MADRAGDIYLPLGAITDNDHLVELVARVLQVNGELSLVIDLYGLGYIANIGDPEGRIRGRHDLKIAARIRGGAAGGPHDRDRNIGKSFPALPRDLSGDPDDRTVHGMQEQDDEVILQHLVSQLGPIQHIVQDVPDIRVAHIQVDLLVEVLEGIVIEKTVVAEFFDMT